MGSGHSSWATCVIGELEQFEITADSELRALGAGLSGAEATTGAEHLTTPDVISMFSIRFFQACTAGAAEEKCLHSEVLLYLYSSVCTFISFVAVESLLRKLS